ncbi:MAG: alpha/beta hydrolase family protein, partial [bacterium]
VQDIGALLDWIAQQPELDASRVGVTGGSYGGYMTLAVLCNYNDRIRAAVDVVGISNFVTFLESTSEYRRDLRRVEYGDERDPKMREFLLKISPTTNAHKITKPLFVIQGLNDPRVPAMESEQMVKTVRKNGGTVWYLVGKDEGHGFRKKGNVDYQTNAVSLFWETFLLDGKQGTN